MSVVEPDAGQLGGGDVVPVRRTPVSMAWRRFRGNIGAVVGLFALSLVILVVLIAPFFISYTPTEIDLDRIREAPSAAHWLGTDATGRDVLTRLVYGGRISLMVGFCTAISALAVGTTLGVVAGRVGGFADAFIMRITDLFMSIPGILVVIVLAGILGPSIVLLIVLIAAFAWPGSCRIARSVVLSVRELEYVQAAHAAGTRPLRIATRHLLPAVLPQVLVSGTMLIAGAILAEAGLSFLGLGVVPPSPSWGNMLLDAQSLSVLSSMPWLWVPPGAAISITTLSVIFIGDGLRDAFDPKGSR